MVLTKGLVQQLRLFQLSHPRITKLMIVVCLMAAACALAGVIIIFLKRDIAREGPSPYPQADSPIAGYPPRPDTNDTAVLRAYIRHLFLLQETKQQDLGCEPKLKVVRLVDLIKEDEEMYNELHDILKPGQAVALRRCIDEESYCPGANKKCVPGDGFPVVMKRIIIHVYNNTTVGAFVPISRNVAEYTVCVCQDYPPPLSQLKLL